MKLKALFLALALMPALNIFTLPAGAAESDNHQRSTAPLDKDDLFKPLRKYFGYAKIPEELAHGPLTKDMGLVNAFEKLMQVSESGDPYPEFMQLKNGLRVFVGCDGMPCTKRAAIVMNEKDEIVSAVMFDTPAFSTDYGKRVPKIAAYIFKNPMDYTFENEQILRDWLRDERNSLDIDIDHVVFMVFENPDTSADAEKTGK